MRSVISIIFNARQTLELSVDVEPGDDQSAAARDWIDAQWHKLGCEPLRHSGKVLLLDKVLGVSDALGYTQLSQDSQQAQDFATQLALALEKPRITVDLPGLVVGF